MKALRDFLRKIEPSKDKKYAHTTWDAFYTFAFAPATTTSQGAHIRDGMDLKRTMFHVVIAMQLCLMFGAWNIGHHHYAAYGEYVGYLEGFLPKLFFGLIQVLPIIIVTHVVGLGVEFIFAATKGHSVEEGFLVSGMLIPLICPPDIPLWMLAVAVAFAVLIGKEAFGGTGMNILNVALLARVFLFFAYPTYMSGDTCWITWDTNWIHDLFGLGVQGLADYGPQNLVQGMTGATPLGLAATGFEENGVMVAGLEGVTRYYSLEQMIIGAIPGSIGESSKIAIILGAVILLVTKIADYRIMLSMLIGCIGMGFLFNLFPANEFLELPWYYHIFMGSFLFAMVFMATDPVTASQTSTGKWIYGLLIGVVGMIVRVLNPAYPEGWMLAILFVNVLAPLIDHYVVSANIQKRLSRVK